MSRDVAAEQPHSHRKGLLRRDHSRILVGLAGQPNTGKSTVFNHLTGLRQHTGNWPGKTIEKRTGVARRDGTRIDIVDLPGSYGLTAHSPEEQVSRDFILFEKPQVVVLVANVVALDRSLYLLSELLALRVPVVLALNMMDIAEKEGIHVDVAALEEELGVPVIPLMASRGKGINTLLAKVIALAEDPSEFRPRPPAVPEQHREVLANLTASLAPVIPAGYPADWAAAKLLEGDAQVTELARGLLGESGWLAVSQQLTAHPDAVLEIAGARYRWIDGVTTRATARPDSVALHLTERIDRAAAHPLFGLPILLLVFGAVYWFTFTIATPVQDWLDTNIVVRAGDWLRDQSFLPGWLVGLIGDGVLAGAGTVLTFVPLLILFFLALGVLEDTGYMARAAYVMDRFMHLVGLHGKSVLPLVLGFGCNVPSVMGARILESRSSRLTTIMVAPFVPCAARFAVLAFLTPVFFGAWAPLVAVGLVALNLVILAVIGLALSSFAFKGGRTALIMELPVYHVPNARTIGLFIWNNVIEFVQKAAIVIVLVSIVVWVLSSYPGSGIEESVLGRFGQLVEPVGQLMGLDWRSIVAVLTSFPAKENAIATLGVLFGAGEDDAGLRDILRSELSAAQALSFLTVTMLFIPCMATVAVMRREMGSWTWTLISSGLCLGVALAGGIVVYHVAAALGG
ncbi:MAG: ferrous iron transport protein B [Dehalococcoidia bacterium]|nr:ferrous iron transport protein B [Dehalococcoidia bacterium]